MVPYGLAVRIPGFHPGGPGSTPGMGSNVSRFKFQGSCLFVTYTIIQRIISSEM